MKNFFFTNSLVLLFLCNTTLLLAQKETRNVGSYEGIHIAGHYDVSLFSGSEGTITLEVDAEDLDQIETYIKNGTLVIKQKKSFWLNNWFSDQVSIQIPVEEVSKVNLSGSGDIRSNFPLKTDHFKTNISGSGDITLEIEATSVEGMITGSGDLQLKGSAERTEYTVTGSGSIEAQDLKSLRGQAQITGSGDIELHANEGLEARVTGSGDVRCFGDPERQITRVTGSGNITIRN